MKNEPPKKYNWHDSANWDEFKWEQLMRDSDSYASNYFTLLSNFGDLPRSDEFIQNKLKGMPCPQQEENDFFEELEKMAFDEMPPMDEGDVPDSQEYELQADLPLFHEQQKSYTLLRHTALGWCNIQASYLQPSELKDGLNTLYHLGRALSHLTASLGDGVYEDNLGANIASSKRCLAQLNSALGRIKIIEKANPSYALIVNSISVMICQVHDLVVSHLLLLKSKKVTSS